MLHYEFPGYATGELGRGGRVANLSTLKRILKIKEEKLPDSLLIFCLLFFISLKNNYDNK